MNRTIFIVFLNLIAYASFGGIGVKKIADLSSKLKETSGLEYYKGKLITHNDSGDGAKLYVINKDGEVEEVYKIKDADNDDWEDLTAAPDGRFFIGDIGNNNNDRKHCQVYVLDDDFLDDKGRDPKADKISFSYDDQYEYPPAKNQMYYDAEALFWMKDSLYILTKCRTSPFTGRSFVYVIPDKPGHYKARKIGEIPFCSTSWLSCSVTSADYHAASNTLVVLLYGKLVTIQDFPGNRFWEGQIKTYNIPSIKQREAITFVNKKKLYMTDEQTKFLGGGNLYEVIFK